MGTVLCTDVVPKAELAGVWCYLVDRVRLWLVSGSTVRCRFGDGVST